MKTIIPPLVHAIMLIALCSHMAIAQKTLEAPLMEQCVPNPVVTSCSVSYYVPSDATEALFYLRNDRGNVVKISEPLSIGHGIYRFQTEDLPSGNYYYTLAVDYQQIETRKMLIKH